MIEKTERRVKAAISYIILNLAFFMVGLLKLEIIYSDRFPTGATDGKSLWLNPDFIDSLTHEEIVFVLCHEVMHCLLLHHLRMRGRDHAVWNEATDYAINYILAQYNLKCPKGCLLDTKYGLKPSEQVYDALMSQRQQDQQQDQQDQQQNDQSGDGDSQEGGDQQEDQDGAEGDSGDGDGDDSQDGDENATGSDSDASSDDASEGGSGGSGSGSDMGQDDIDPDPNGMGGVIEPEDLTDDQIEEAQIDWQTTMAQSYAAGENAGNMPGAVKQMVKEILHPTVDWREALRDLLEDAAANDYSLLQPDIRFSDNEFLMPSMESTDELGEVVLAVDTSGSIFSNPKLVAFFSAEITSILEEFNCKATVIYCDTRVTKVEEYESDDLPIQLTACGGGGTDFRPPFAHVEKHDLDPVCMIYFTDLWCYSYPEEPDYPVIWAATDMYKANDVPFGEVAKITID